MARIWTDIEIEWDGQTYTVRPTFKLINHLERYEGRSISKLFQRAMARDLPSGAACELIADTLTFAGAEDVTAEDVFVATSGGVDSVAVTLATQILLACMPTPKDPPKAATGAKKKPAVKKSTGAKSTG